MPLEKSELEKALVEAIQRAEKAAIKANKAVKKVKKAKRKVKLLKQLIITMREQANEKSIRYQEDIVEIISKAKKKKKALKKIAKLNETTNAKCQKTRSPGRGLEK